MNILVRGCDLVDEFLSVLSHFCNDVYYSVALDQIRFHGDIYCTFFSKHFYEAVDTPLVLTLEKDRQKLEVVDKAQPRSLFLSHGWSSADVNTADFQNKVFSDLKELAIYVLQYERAYFNCLVADSHIEWAERI